jgi:hypothetical protein
MHDDRRKAERHPIALRVQTASGEALTRDFSGLGVLFETRDHFAVGQEIEFNIITPDDVPVRCRGDVVRVTDGDNGSSSVAARITGCRVSKAYAANDNEQHLVIRELRRHQPDGWEWGE